MKDIDIADLIHIVPDILNLFLAGFVFIMLYGWLNSKKYDISVITIWSLVISYIIKSICATFHSFILTSVDINEYLKVVIYIVIAVGLAIGITKLVNTKKFRSFLYNVNYKTIHDDAFDDIIDYDKPTMMQIYLRDSDKYYIGKFIYREENGTDSWIVLINYCSVDRKTNDIVYNPMEDKQKSSVTINIRDVESIELIYEDDSEVWKYLSGEEDDDDEIEENNQEEAE